MHIYLYMKLGNKKQNQRKKISEIEILKCENIGSFFDETINVFFRHLAKTVCARRILLQKSCLNFRMKEL